MNSHRLQISASALLAVIAHPTHAYAAQMGPLSRASVSISVTVPPHIMVTPAAASLNASSAVPTLCVGTNGFSQYHLAMIRHSGATEEDEVLEGGGRTGGSLCPGAIPVVPQAVAEMEPSSPGTLTLLIIPD